MAEGDAVEKFLEEKKSFDDRRQALVDDLLRQKAEAIKAFDERLAKLGHVDGKPRKSHHKKVAADAAATIPKHKKTGGPEGPPVKSATKL